LTTVSPGAEYMLPGYQIGDIPRWSMALTTNYDWALTDVWDGHVGGALRWIDKRWSAFGVQSRSAGGAPTMELPAYSVLDLNASIARGPLMLRAFVRNLTDTRAKLHAFVQGDPASPPASMQERILQPRLIGVGFDYAF
jgi:outer membrane receptor protein involved in Fe transport